ncbi:hypothetical protein C8Q80DRAFT_1270003 [Daedaleopsis nitida]|nr:hypothetical protein C8Q80DRAFT_1270003 [Daedaleopsis nitida]
MGIPTRAPLTDRTTISIDVPTSPYEPYTGEPASNSHQQNDLISSSAPTALTIPRSDTTPLCDPDISHQCECSLDHDDSDDSPLRSLSPLYDYRETEIEMVLQYISDWEDGRYDDCTSTRTQGLRGISRAGNRPRDEDPSRNRPTKVPLSYLLRKIRFASA